MNTIRLILGLMIGGIEVAAGRRKGAVSSYTRAKERTTGPASRAGRPLFGKNSALASWAQSGGFGVVAKIQRRITAKEREAIHAGLAQGKSGAQLAAALGRDASVVNREITRNGGRSSYSGMDAQTRTCRRPKCAARNKVADTPALRDEVLALFATGATPKQIAVALRRRHGLDLTRRVSHETNLRLHLRPLQRLG
ncbi:MAG: helix-turn-helix domain-containing protein [Candidatus Synoicihabitans palmerolidicus]|nr:helix-turn-helix domain-containing protein [Candidatus Synoicihabitans palmerolidicus]